MTLSVGISAAFLACGQFGTHEGSSSYTPTPTPTGSIPQPSGNPHLERYAKITSSSPAVPSSAAVNSLGLPSDYSTYTNWGPLGAVDNVRPISSTINGGIGFMWRPSADIDSSWIQLDWNGRVNISSIQLYDDPSSSRVLKYEVAFSDSTDPTKMISPATSSTPLPDDGTTAGTVSGPSDAVTTARIKILNHSGNTPSIGEILVSGSFVNEDIASINVAPYSYVKNVSSTALPADGTFSNAGYAGYDVGPFRTAFVKDDNANTFWASKNGSNAFIELELDRTYAITKIELTDRPALHSCTKPFGSIICSTADSAPHLTYATVIFNDISKKCLYGTPPQSVTGVLCTDLLSGSSIQSKDVRVELSGLTNSDARSGLSEIKITGSFAP